MGTVFANNVIMGGSTAAKIEGPHPDATWSGNVLWTVIANGDFPDSGAQRMDPELEVIPDGVARPREESPLIAAATGEFPAVQVDIDGQTRPPMKTIGADDVSTNPGTVRALTPEDVGPHRP